MAIIVHPQHLETYLQNSKPVEQHPGRRPVRWQHLPLDILHNIAKQLASAREVLVFEQICKSSRAAAQDDTLWQKLCVSKFNTPPMVKGGSTWRDLYRYNHRILYDVLMFRRPEKLIHLGNGVIYINLGIPVQA